MFRFTKVSAVRRSILVAVALVVLAYASVASAATPVQYGGPAGNGPVGFDVTGNRIQLAVLQDNIGRCIWMVYTNNHVVGHIKHGAFHMSKTFSNGSKLKISGTVVSRSKLKGTIHGIVPGHCDATVKFTATRS